MFNDIRAVSYRSLVLPTLLFYVFFVIVILFLLFKYHMYIYLSYYYFDMAQIHERRMRERGKLHNESPEDGREDHER